MEELLVWLKECFLLFTLENYCREKAPLVRENPVVDKRESIYFLVIPFQ
jgi:hypothetical protein